MSGKHGKAALLRQVDFLFQKAEDTRGFSSHDLNKVRCLLETLGMLEAKKARYTAIRGYRGVKMAGNVSNYEKPIKAPQNAVIARGQV